MTQPMHTVPARQGREIGSFNDQWLEQLQWQLLRVDGEVAYYRVRSPNAVRPWLILRPAGSGSEQVFRRLEHEFHLRELLDPAWAVVPTALLYTAEGPLLVLDEPGGRSLDDTLGSELSITLFLQLALGAAQALACLHSQGVLHRDLKPCHFLEGEDGVVRLSGFALSSRRSEAGPDTAVISGSLAYMSPEQAGRVGGATDERSDLYSLGVTFYELLTGRLPFTAGDAVQWLHQHLAQPPLPPQRARADVPPALAAIVLRLLAKDPAQRYPDAATLAQVLRRALVQWRENAEIPLEVQTLEPASGSPLSGTWAQAPALAGRDLELARLHALVSQLREDGDPVTVLVSGTYGTGKTALLRQLHQDLAASPLRFAACRFDPARQSTPYAAVCGALRGLLLQVLGERPTALQRWRQRLHRALGARAHLMLAMLPEIEWVLGPVPAEGERGAGEERVLDELLADCLNVFARSQKPLLLFFDDLQWLDRESLVFFAQLPARRIRHLLLVGAYREASGEHEMTFVQLLQRLRDDPVAGAPVQRIKLQSLDRAAVQAMLAGQLRWQSAQLAPLAELLMEKTAGNPFFVQQLACSFIEDGLLEAATDGPGWRWDLQRLGQYPVAQNVLELMLCRLGRLPGSTRRLLGLLAMLGSRADARSVARLADYSVEAVRSDLQPALTARLLIADAEGWRFSHDRVRESAWRLVPDDKRSIQHTRIARWLISEMSDPMRLRQVHGPFHSAGRRPGPATRANDPRGMLFRIALHIQQAARDEVLEADRTAFIDILLQAAQRARDTAALPFALEYLRLARNLGTEQRWLHNPVQSRAVEQLYVQCLVHGGEYVEADTRITRLLERATRLEQRAALHVLKVHASCLAGDYAGAVQAALTGLALFDIDFTGRAGQPEPAYERVHALLGGRPVASLIELPVSRDSLIDAAQELLASLIVPAAFSRPGLALPVVCRMTELALLHGVSPVTPRGLAWFGVALAHQWSDYQQGLRFADLASRLVARLPVPAHEASMLLALGQVSAWVRPLRFSIECLERAISAGRSEGAAATSCYASHQLVCLLMAQGVALDKVRARSNEGLLLAGLPGTGDAHLLLQTQSLFIGRLLGDSAVSAQQWTLQQQAVSASGMAPAQLGWWLFDAIQAWFDGAYAHSLASLDRAQALAWSMPAHIHQLDLVLYRALNLAALHPPGADPAATLTAMAPAQASLRRWADLNPSLCLDKLLLVEGEMARIEDQPLRALGLYEQAIAQAGSMESVPLLALAHELAARCSQQQGLVTAARSHWRRARDAYLRWGALAKVGQLEAAHQGLHDQPGDGRSSVELRQGQQHLDLISVTKASQALSREVVFDRLIETLISNTLAHAGAQRGALVLLHKGEPLVVARGQSHESGVETNLARVSLDEAQLPVAVIYRVLRSGQWLVLNDAQQAADSRDSLSGVPGSGSMLCLPLLKQGEVTGVVYLENPLARGLFSEARIALIELLAAQAAISIEISRLYGELLEENQRRRDTEVQLRSARSELAQVNQSTLMGELAASIAHEINQPLVSIVANASASVRWLNRDQPQVGEALEGLRDIVGDGRRAADIVVALQALAKQRTPNRSRLIIDDVIRQVLLLTASDAEHRHVAVTTRLGTAGSRVFADGVLMQQVIYNLVINAMDAMATLDEGQRRLTLVSSVEAGSQVVVTVEDTGGGIEEAHLGKVFDAFFTTKPNGMGMGLAICRSIMIAQGGTLHAMRGRAEETLFVFSLPVTFKNN